MRDIMYHHQPTSPRLTDVKDTNIFAILSPKIIRRQRSLTSPIDLEKSTSVPNFPPITRTKSDSQDRHSLRSLDIVTSTGKESIRNVYAPQKPRPPRPGTPTFNSPFFRRRVQTQNPLEKRVHSEPAMDISLLSAEQRSQVGLPSSRPGSRPGSRSSLTRPKLRATISCSSTSNNSNDELNKSSEYIPHHGRLGLTESPRYHTRQHFHFANRTDQQDEPLQLVSDASPSHDCIIESDEVVMDKISDLATKDLVDKCQKWLEGVVQANEEPLC